MEEGKQAVRARLAILGHGLGLIAVLTGCQKPAEQAPPPPPEVSVVIVQPRLVPVDFDFVGQTEGSREVEIRTRVTGILLKRSYTEGALVKQGAQLFLIDPAPFQTAGEEMRGVVAQAEAALAKAQRDVARLKPLFAENAVSRKDLDDATSAEQSARAAQISARAQLKKAQLDLGYTRVDAPISGITSRAAKSEGSLVIAGADSLLTKISQVDPIYVNFSYADNDLLQLRKEIAAGQTVLPKDNQFDVELRLADGSIFSERGKLNFNDQRVSAETGTIQARAQFPNPKAQLFPGQFVRVFLKGTVRPNAIVVPQRAVLQGQKGQFVFVVGKEGKAEVHAVETGDTVGEDILIASGLAAGDRVVVDGAIRVQPGSPVRVAAATPGKAATAPGVAEH